MKTLIAVVLIVAISFLGLANFLGWFTVNTEREEQPGQTKAELKITVDKQKANQDVDHAKKAIKENANDAKKALKQGARKTGERATDAANKLAGATIVEGKITKVNTEENKVTLQVGENQHEVKVNGETELLDDGDVILFEDLEEGAQAKISFKEEDGVKVAWRVLVRTNNAQDG